MPLGQRRYTEDRQRPDRPLRDELTFQVYEHCSTDHDREAAESVAMSRWQTLRMVILPQCIKRMTPPWMNLYAILTVATPLTSVVGVSEAMTLTGDILSAEARTELLVPMYLYLLLWFFLYCYPIARATQALEQRFQVR